MIAEPADVNELAKLLLAESTTLGVRIAYEDRLELPRRMAKVSTEYGEVEVKVATRPDGSLRSAPEYESVRRIAEEAQVPITEVYRAALRADVPMG